MSEEGKVSRAFVIPVGRSVDDSGTVVRIAFLQSCDAYLPSKIAKWEGLFKGIGGAVEGLFSTTIFFSNFVFLISSNSALNPKQTRNHGKPSLENSKKNIQVG